MRTDMLSIGDFRKKFREHPYGKTHVGYGNVAWGVFNTHDRWECAIQDCLDDGSLKKGDEYRIDIAVNDWEMNWIIQATCWESATRDAWTKLVWMLEEDSRRVAKPVLSLPQSGRSQLQAEGASLSAAGCGLSEVTWSGTQPTTV